ncbi:hypothetical protein PR048_017884 [Dryococelus australis]|uniref:Uncharacterized protein n=1 Tax=Dryococelus australis TaxID=614101 RepID=A0ABQ9HAU7_9NEOP|nr:hypothetical protein PR048_017884 [Dryococelus australis]
MKPAGNNGDISSRVVELVEGGGELVEGEGLFRRDRSAAHGDCHADYRCLRARARTQSQHRSNSISFVLTVAPFTHLPRDDTRQPSCITTVRRDSRLRLCWRTWIQVDLKRGFEKCSIYREQPIPPCLLVCYRLRFVRTVSKQLWPNHKRPTVVFGGFLNCEAISDLLEGVATTSHSPSPLAHSSFCSNPCCASLATQKSESSMLSEGLKSSTGFARNEQFSGENSSIALSFLENINGSERPARRTSGRGESKTKICDEREAVIAVRGYETTDAHISVAPNSPTLAALRRAKFLQPGGHLNVAGKRTFSYAVPRLQNELQYGTSCAKDDPTTEQLTSRRQVRILNTKLKRHSPTKENGSYKHGRVKKIDEKENGDEANAEKILHDLTRATNCYRGKARETGETSPLRIREALEYIRQYAGTHEESLHYRCLFSRQMQRFICVSPRLPLSFRSPVKKPEPRRPRQRETLADRRHIGKLDALSHVRFYIKTNFIVTSAQTTSRYNDMPLHGGYWLLLRAARKYNSEQAPAHLATNHHTQLSWIGERDEVHFEPPKLVVRNLDPRSAAIVDKCSLKKFHQIEEIQNHEISLVDHFYIGTKIKLDPGSELGSFYFGSGKLLLQPGIKLASGANSSRTRQQYGVTDRGSTPERRLLMGAYGNLLAQISAALNIEILRADQGEAK